MSWLVHNFGDLVEVEIDDVRNAGSVQRAVEDASLVFHFAAQVAVTTSLTDPLSDFTVNAQGTLNVLEACRQCVSPPPLLFTSTNKVYGNLNDVPLRVEGECYKPQCPDLKTHGVSERQPLNLHSPYGCSKGVADQYVLDYARCFRLPTVVFRMSCIYGPHQCGTEDQGWVAHFVRKTLRDEPITIYGDGCQVRDILYVQDLTRAMTGALEHIDKTRGRAFNVGGGPKNAVSLLNVIDFLADIHGQAPDLHLGEWRQGDQRYYVSNTQSLNSAIGWRPEIAAREGLGRLYHWMAAERAYAEADTLAAAKR